MNTPVPNPLSHDKPAADDLAGIPMSKEEDEPKVRPRSAQNAKVRKPGRKKNRSTQQAPSPPDSPTVDELAGIPLSAEGEEELGARPQTQRPRQQS